AERESSQLAVWGGPPDSVEGQGDSRQEEEEGKAGDQDSRTSRSGTRPLAGSATLAGRRAERPARKVSCRPRPLRSGRQDPEGSGSPTRCARRDRCGPVGEGAGHAGEAARSAGSGRV